MGDDVRAVGPDHGVQKAGIVRQCVDTMSSSVAEAPSRDCHERLWSSF